ncbi:MAG: hypothetical protein QOK71_10650 [Nitrososphaeraceae archaeon]|nr:hypothetical protein [Nitrososphaeraceae archaeon]
MIRRNKNSGPCAIKNCDNNNKSPEDVNFRTITEKTFKNIREHHDYESVNYLRLNEQLCTNHYMKYVAYYKRRRLDIEQVNKHSSNDIKINITENGVLLSEEDFGSLMQKIENLETKIEEKNNEIESIFDVNNVFLTVQNNFKKSSLSFADKIELLTNVLLKQQRESNEAMELDPTNFCKLIEEKEPKLKGFFDELAKIIPERRTNSIRSLPKNLL